jgi:integrase
MGGPLPSIGPVDKLLDERCAWASQTGGYLAPPAARESWLSGAAERCQKADRTFPRITAHALRHTSASLAISASSTSRSAASQPLSTHEAQVDLGSY